MMLVISITSLILLSSGVDSPEPLWTNDELVWDMTTNTTWIGYGYTYCDAIYDPFSQLYAVAIADGVEKDTLKICRYINNPPDPGYWDNMTGMTADVLLTDPVISLISYGAEDFISFYTVVDIGAKGMIQGTRLLLPDCTFNAILFPDWSNPLAGEIRSITVISLPNGNTQWIFADDVKCTHGSTVGQLDDTAVFYLRSRGIGEEAARSLLTYAFASDIVDRIRVESVKRDLEEFLFRRLPKGDTVRQAV